MKSPVLRKCILPQSKNFVSFVDVPPSYMYFFMCNMSACCKPIPNQHDYEFEGDIGVDADANGDGNHIETDVDADAGDNVNDKDPQGRRRERPPELFEDDLVEGEVAGEQVQDQDGGQDHLGHRGRDYKNVK